MKVIDIDAIFGKPSFTRSWQNASHDDIWKRDNYPQRDDYIPSGVEL